MKRLTLISLALSIGLLCVCVGYGEEKAKPPASEPVKPPAAEPAKPQAPEPVKPSAPETAKPPVAEPAKPPAPETVKPPAPAPVKAPPSEPAKPAVFGVEVDQEIVWPTVESAAKSEKVTGLHVRRVLPGTAAEQAGLQTGDVIVQINDHRIKSFDDVVAALVEQQSNRKGCVQYARKGRIASGYFTPGDPYDNQDFNLVYIVWARESRYAKRLDICGIVSNTTETKTGTCGSFAILGPLIFDYHKVGDAEKVTTLLFLTIPWGVSPPVIF